MRVQMFNRSEKALSEIINADNVSHFLFCEKKMVRQCNIKDVTLYLELIYFKSKICHMFM